jgi:cytochrome c oxidase assembly protein subunit 15
VLLLLGALQGLAGWYMVKSGLIKDPHVSHYRLAIHLLLAFTTFGFTFWYALDLLCPEREWGASVKVRNWARALLAATVVQIIYGAFVAGLKAGYLYPTFPKMGTEWMPAEVTSLEPAWKNFTEGHAGVQFAHRYIACVVVLLTILVFYHSRKAAASATQKRVAIWLLVLTGAQFTLGVCTLVFNMPIAIAALHQTGAFFLFAALLYMLHRSRT